MGKKSIEKRRSVGGGELRPRARREITATWVKKH